MKLQFKEQDFRLQAVQCTHDIRQRMQTLAVRGTNLKYNIAYVMHRRSAKLPDAECVQFLWYDYVNSVLKMKFLPELYRAREMAVIRHVLPGTVTGRTLPPYHGRDCTAPKTITYQAKCDAYRSPKHN